MSLLQKLKSVFGLGDDDGGKSRRDVGVTVEHEPSEPDEPEPATETESAVKGADVDSSAAETDAPAVDESDAATEESETAVDEGDAATEESETAVDESEAAAEEAIEEAEPDAEGEEEPAETEADAEAEAEPEEPEPEAPEGTLEDVKGIGPAYAERLRNAGVDSIADLADADAEDLAAETDLSATRIENWIEQAKVR